MASDTPSEPFGTFAEFYPFYMSQHANRTARLLHYVGTALVIGLAIYA
ncbi:MAG: Mpo1-like protein, partial [Pseudomonadota bacterium]